MRPSGVWAKAFITVVVWAGIVSGPAQAGCSHHVAKSARASSVEFRLTVFGDAGAPTDTIERRSTFPEQPARCSGALCSGQPAPVSSAALIDLQRAGNWAILSTPTPSTVLETASSPPDERVVLPIARGSSVDHPPRLPSSILAL
jgi:hypothetical protein